MFLMHLLFCRLLNSFKFTSLKGRTFLREMEVLVFFLIKEDGKHRIWYGVDGNSINPPRITVNFFISQYILTQFFPLVNFSAALTEENSSLRWVYCKSQTFKNSKLFLFLNCAIVSSVVLNILTTQTNIALQNFDIICARCINYLLS